MSEKQTGGGRKFLQVGPNEVMTLSLASLARELELALKLDRPGLSDEEDSLTDARWLRPELWKMVDDATERS